MTKPADLKSRRIDTVAARLRPEVLAGLAERGDVVLVLEDGDDMDVVRAAVRRIGRAAGIKVRTGGRDGLVWVADVTPRPRDPEAARREGAAAAEAVDALLSRSSGGEVVPLRSK